MASLASSSSCEDRKCARFASIPDLLASSDPSELGLVRIVGRLESYDSENSILWLRDHHQTASVQEQVAVDVTNIEPFPYRRGTLYQFIGESDFRAVAQVGNSKTSTECVVLKALLSRCVDGLDMEMYLKAHEVRMQDFKSCVSLLSGSTPESQEYLWWESCSICG